MSTMTLELKRDDECLWLHVSNGKQHGMFNLGKGLRDGGNETLAVQLLREYIDAHLAKFTPDWAGNRQGVEDGKAEALAQPAQAVDVGAIREVINYLQDEGNACIATGDGLDAQWGSRILSMGRKLARALSGEKAGPVGDAYCGLRIVENADVPDGELWVYSRKALPASPAPDKEGR